MPFHESREKDEHGVKSKRSESKVLAAEVERKMVIEEVRSEKGRDHVKEESMSSGSKVELDPKKIMRRARSKSDFGREKGR